ncbi:patatin-like phospholipase family protein [Phycicoccus sp. BSK3Z-2]|uniref:Patatin-like phospholipase family protein n=1 Tax=Phycicoccus avicenniae TaxID=2828860 RepID=A0A941D827_9MICO|nr:patatin-like phospholipase family protein [Phycicoccus avicenniae]MBR7743799.1 patatin-like phospholipase family protein [Phycicoccus avicenniae]
MSSSGPGRTALVLDAGGARSAYQVGALAVLLPELERRGETPTVLLGTSAGALLSAALTATAHEDAATRVARLEDVLFETTKDRVMRPFWRQVPEVALRYTSETFGLSWFRLRGFVGTGPLAATLERSLDWDALHDNVDRGLVEVSAVTATAVRTGRVTLFAETAPSVTDLPTPTTEHHRRYLRTRLSVPHLLASSAIPVLFPSVFVDDPDEGAGWYVDGATRRRHPLAPAVELGVDRVVAVGTGSLRPTPADPAGDRESVDIGDGGATLLGAVMDDPLRHDLRRLSVLNEQASDRDLSPLMDRVRERHGLPPYRVLPHVAVLPEFGTEIAGIALEVFRQNHGGPLRLLGDPDLQLVHRILGSDSPLQGELLSYLMFDPDFFTEVAALGRRDAQLWLRENPDLWRTRADDALAGHPG